MTFLKKTVILLITAFLVMGTAACKEKTPSEKAADDAEKAVEETKKLFKD